MNPKNLMFQYSIVTRTYKDTEDKLVVYTNLTDGWVTTPISKYQREQLLRQAQNHERYEIGFEQYFEPTGDIAIDGYNDDKSMLRLQTIIFHHIFILSDYLDEVFQDFNEDRKIHFIKKQDELLDARKRRQHDNAKNKTEIQD